MPHLVIDPLWKPLPCVLGFQYILQDFLLDELSKGGVELSVAFFIVRRLESRSEPSSFSIWDL